jgi:anti-sigma regulatory factor (Ser/Thr protein kinase)
MNQLVRTFARHTRSPGYARAALRTWAAEQDRLPQDTVDIAVLLLTELVTNACRHVRKAVGGNVTVRCHIRNDLAPARLRVEVHDADTRLPAPREAGLDAEGGRGLALVEALAAAWAAEPLPDGDGKIVWFELELPEDPATAFTARFAPLSLPVPAYLASPGRAAAPTPGPPQDDTPDPSPEGVEYAGVGGDWERPRGGLRTP